MTPKISVGFIGLGTMGYPMAGHLANKGFDVHVYNRTRKKAEQWMGEYTGSAHNEPATLAEHCSIICLCVGNDDDLRAIMLSKNGVLAGSQSNTLIIDHTTTSADVAIEMASKCAQNNIKFMDAPVSGGQAGAQNGTLTAMCGANATDYEAAQSVLKAYCGNTQRIGDVGQGQRCKMVNQICIAGVLSGLSEALSLVKANNLPIEQVTEALKGGAAGSWQLTNRLKTMSAGEFDFGFALDWMIKDLGICLDEAAKQGIHLPLTEEVTKKYQGLSEDGKGRLDTSALVLSKPN